MKSSQRADLISYFRIICLLFFLIVQGAHARLTFESLSSEKGVDLVRDIYRSTDGYLWVATSSQGLMRVDGYATKWYQVDENQSDGIASNSVASIAEDLEGNLWLGTKLGLAHLNRQTDGFTNYTHDPENPRSLADNKVYKVIIDDEDTLWALSAKAVHRYVPETDDFDRCYVLPESGSKTSLFNMSIDTDGTVWILSGEKGIHHLDPESGEMTFYPNTEETDYYPWLKQRIELDADGQTIWMTINNAGLFRFNKEDHSFYLYPIDKKRTGIGIPSTSVNDLIHLDDDTLVVGIDQAGISILDKKLNRFTYITEKSDGAAGLTTNGVSRFYIDYDNILWLGTTRGGIFYDNPRHYNFKTYKNESLTGSIVGTVFEDSEGLIWIGTDGNGINLLDKRTNQFSYITTENSDLSSDIIRFFDEDSNGDIWITTWDGGINRYVKESNQIEQIELPKEVIEYQSRAAGIWRFQIDDKGNYWLINNAATLHLDQQFNIIDTHFLLAPGRYRSGALYQFGDDTIYFSNCYGAYRYNPERSKMEPIIEGLRVVQLAKGNQGNYYLATQDNGLYIVSSEGQVIKNLTIADGLVDNSLRALELEDENALWVSSVYGMSRINLVDYSISNFYVKDGLQGDSYFIQSSTRLRDGSLAFGGEQGISFWQPAHTTSEPLDAPIYIQNIQVANEDLDMSTLASEGQATLDSTSYMEVLWKSKVISVEFAAVGFTYPDNIRYEYMLKGFDSSWTETDSQDRKATYTNLSPDSYELIVRAQDAQGNWSPHTARLKIKVIPPFWMTTWFYILLLIIALIAVRIYLNTREKKLRAEKVRLQEEVEERSRLVNEMAAAKEQAERSDRLKSQFLANMSHEIRTPMNAIVGFSELLSEHEFTEEEKGSFIENISSGAHSLLALIEDILDLSMIEADQLSIKNSDFKLTKLIDEIYTSFAVIEQSDQVKFECNIAPECAGSEIHSDYLRIKQIVSNLVNNALKFTDEGFVRLGARNESDALVIYVKDTGGGIQKADVEAIFSEFVRLDRHNQQAVRGVGLGLTISKRLADMLSCKLDVDSTRGEGSEFRLTIPKTLVTEAPASTEATSELNNRSKDRNWKNKHLLIAEDEESNYKYLEQALKHTGIQISWAVNGAEAVEMIQGSGITYDLVLMDLNMPKMDGYAAVRKVKRLKPELKVIAQTAYAMESDESKCMKAGFDAYLSKPILPKALLSELANYL